MREIVWNVVSESIRREHGFSGGFDRRPFTTNCLGSLYIVQKMRWSHQLTECLQTFNSFNFNHDGTLLCMGLYNRNIDVIDWKQKRRTFTFKTKHSKPLYDVKFLNTGGGGMDLISADFGGQVRHTCIAPSGYYISKRIFLNTNQVHRLITVPGSPLEFLAGSSNGGIFQIDLRAESWSPVPSTIVSKEAGYGFLQINDMSHHPLAPEICICGNDKVVRIFDKRNLNEPLKKLCPNNLTNGDTSYLIHCSYNYNGSEILAHYHQKGAYLFDNQCNNDGEFLYLYDRTTNCLFDFFGSTSEFLVLYDGLSIAFRNKRTNVAVGNSDITNTTSISHTLSLELHPSLPIVATMSSRNTLDIWGTTNMESSMG